MEFVNLDEIIKNIYDNRVSFIRSKNIELEREYFTENSSSIPMGEIMEGVSFEDHFTYFKHNIKYKGEDEISQIFMLLQEYFLFSYGHDLIFKKKLEADIYTSVPMEDFIFSKLKDDIKLKYNDVSVMKENPNSDSNIKGIDKIIYIYIELQSLLYLLYCYDFQFPNGWEGICPDTCDDVMNILKEKEITIGDFLHALIDHKCGLMTDIFNEIEDKELKMRYLDKVEKLKEEKHNETKSFAHVKLPITYFKDHTLSDFLNIRQDSAILDDYSTKVKKILLP